VFVLSCFSHILPYDRLIIVTKCKISKTFGSGFIFRADSTTSNFYLFRVCQDGTVAFFVYGNNIASTAGTLLSPHFESAMNAGLNQINLVAVVARGYIFDLFVNHHKVANIIDNNYSGGQIGVDADSYPGNDPTEVVYSNAKVWVL
jgi:hypothetical protein